MPTCFVLKSPTEEEKPQGQSRGFRLEIAEVIFAWPFLECHPPAEISFLELRGTVKENVAPPLGLFSAQRRPP